MALPDYGELSLSDIAAEFGGVAPHALNEYYDADTGVPKFGEISISDFYGKSSKFSWSLAGSNPVFKTWGNPDASGNQWVASNLGDMKTSWAYSTVNTSRITSAASSESGGVANRSTATYFGRLPAGSYTFTGTVDDNGRPNSTAYVLLRGYSRGFLSGSFQTYALISHNRSNAFRTNFNELITINSSYDYIVLAVESETTHDGVPLAYGRDLVLNQL